MARIEEDLTHPDSKLYPGIAERLAVMKELHDRGGGHAEFSAYLASIREKYGRRPSLMQALTRAGL